MIKPTKDAYEELQVAYDYFNEHLFEDELPPCLITLQREKKTYGYFSAERFVSREGETTDEIALNPAYFAVCPPEEIMQTLVHEMVHLWQHHFGNKGRGGYHNKEWADKMESLGLMPSSTGQEGGARTGDKMADYIIEGGVFEQLCNDLYRGDFKISWADKFPAKEKVKEAIANGTLEDIKVELSDWGVSVDDDGELIVMSETKPTRVKFTCPKCTSSAWGKPSLHLICGDCNITMTVEN
ncbi:zinc metalloproteinase Mpr protein [Vibrio mediterranei AK1]|uniref:SprT-like domain-containing protein n=1 Tax=Vibrio mediterranei TaxID=689 RepID=UPI0001542811|nr:SprT-like domain-containing protein [Vibrio mediterranei]EDL52175.1 zinc metalloproteinase Mpr protein [Vibrio mediterranei AK1]